MFLTILLAPASLSSILDGSTSIPSNENATLKNIKIAKKE